MCHLDVYQTNLRFVFPLVSMSMRMTSGFLFLLMVSLSLRFPDFSTRPSEGERLYHERVGCFFLHVPIPIFHYPEIQSAVPGDHQGLQCGLDIFPRKDTKKDIHGQ